MLSRGSGGTEAQDGGGWEWYADGCWCQAGAHACELTFAFLPPHHDVSLQVPLVASRVQTKLSHILSSATEPILPDSTGGNPPYLSILAK